ncbi:hypothetical protein HY406_00315 [Candidatus Giovannonibacteria bacterium]|nr:hypothetical protein [Candidatus Giovannonibacteria bacterium]
MSEKQDQKPGKQQPQNPGDYLDPSVRATITIAEYLANASPEDLPKIPTRKDRANNPASS